MNTFKNFFDFFARITLGEMIVFPLFMTVFWGADASVTVSLIWSLLISAFVCALVSVILSHFFFRGGREPSKRRIIVFYIISFVLMNVIVISSGLIFDWFGSDLLPQILGLSGAVAFVYALVVVLSGINDKKTADKMNERLRSRSAGKSNGEKS